MLIMDRQDGGTGADNQRQRERYEAAVSRDWRFRQCFEALVLSPSYRLAHEIASGAIRRPSRGLPRDFPQVEETYKAFGPVHDMTFADWWEEYGQYLFGVAIEPELEVFTSFAFMEEPTGDQLDALYRRIEDYLVIERPTLGPLTTLIMAVPIHPNKQAMMQAFWQLISAAYGKREQPQRVALHSMLKNKVREASVVKALRTARERVAHPDEPLWRIGNRAQVSPLHVTASRADAMDGEVRDKRRVMAILASRELQRAYRLVEHAARGRFPCLDALKPDPHRPVFLAR
jgi:hypothetical protein